MRHAAYLLEGALTLALSLVVLSALFVNGLSGAPVA
jgi:hypothetical protein